MQTEFIWAILQEVNSLWLTISLLSVLFFFFYVKVKFQKRASLKSYGILFYCFVFYSISAISFVFLHAMDTFFRLDHDLYSSFIWFFPVVLLSGLTGAGIGWLIYFAGTKIAEAYVFKLMNLSLLIIAPALVYTLLIQPVRQTINMALLSIEVPKKPKEINVNHFEVLDKQPNVTFFPALPAQLFDSIRLEIQGGNKLIASNNANGFSFQHALAISPIEQLYAATIPHRKQFAILANTPAIQAQSSLLVIDSLGMVVYQQLYEQGVNHLNVSEDGRYILLQKAINPDSLVMATCIRVKE